MAGPRPSHRAPRLLMTTDAVGGVWTYALDLAAGLTDAGVEVVLTVLGPPPSAAQSRAAASISGLEIVPTRLPLDWTASNPAELLTAAEAIRALAQERDVDLVHLNTPALAAAHGFSAPVVGVCHSCLATWWDAVRGGTPPADFRWRIDLNRSGLEGCDLRIAPSRAFALATARAYDLPQPQVVWNGRAPVRPGMPARDPVVVTSGRLWDDGKNAAVLDAAAARMRAPIRAAGPLTGPNGQAIDLGHLAVLGSLPPGGVEFELRRSAVYASSALYEPFGLGVLEAAQAGCALVLSDIPTFRELWDGAATFVDPRDADGLARACDTLVEDADLCAVWGGRARRRAGRYTVDAMVEGVLAIYGRLRPDLFAALREAVA